MSHPFCGSGIQEKISWASFWLMIFHEVSIKSQLRLHSSRDLPRVGDLPPRWLTHVAGELVLVVGWKPWFLNENTPP